MAKIIVLPWLPWFSALALLGRYVLVEKGQDRLIHHELVHIRQQRRYGALNYHLRWLFSKTFRARVEVEAYAEADKLTSAHISTLLKKRHFISISPDQVDAIRGAGPTDS